MSEDKNQKEISYEEEKESFGNDIEKKIKKIKDELKKCQHEKNDYLAGWQRAQADFINYKKRQEERLVNWQKHVIGELIKEILPVLDSLDIAIKHMADKHDKEHLHGVGKIRKQFFDILNKHGLQEIKTVGEKFNPEFHEAIELIEVREEEQILEEVQKGYLLDGKVLRIAKVKVSKLQTNN